MKINKPMKMLESGHRLLKIVAEIAMIKSTSYP